MAQYVIESADEGRFGPCSCCGGETRRVWGYVRYGDAALAAYFVTWIEGQLDRHGANWDFVMGTWGEGAAAGDRVAVALAMRMTGQGPEFMVIDAAGRDMAGPELAGKAMARDELLGTQLAEAVFGMVDAIWAEDGRLEREGAAFSP
jgi:hypothetical protein